jgi:hypothetical protein
MTALTILDAVAKDSSERESKVVEIRFVRPDLK